MLAIGALILARGILNSVLHCLGQAFNQYIAGSFHRERWPTEQPVLRKACDTAAKAFVLSPA